MRITTQLEGLRASRLLATQLRADSAAKNPAGCLHARVIDAVGLAYLL